MFSPHGTVLCPVATVLLLFGLVLHILGGNKRCPQFPVITTGCDGTTTPAEDWAQRSLTE